MHTLINLLLAVALLPVLLPVMALVALFVYIDDGAPIFYCHYRVGRRGQLFRCFKFRSMRTDSQQALAQLLASDPVARAEWERDHKLVNDPRITRIGQFLRKSSLDELPQLFNVLRGEMAFVGPRPITVEELERYGASRWHYLVARPGITGLWQVSGRNELSYDERVALDRQYVEQRSLAHDAGILLRTVLVVLNRHGAR
ncbi:sugar transferase [Sphaerotilus hippei]|nr:sugar transferase [Sphaerotilus hippei]